jgi:NAD(P)-dependent dehydrogenase (short-subunit alcohol dehydrogenase family)
MATSLVAGANRGLGDEYCRQLHTRDDDVIAVCRTASQEFKQLGVQVEEGVDITANASVVELRTRLGDTRLDGLINNAGILKRVTLENLDFDSVRAQFEVNALGPLRVTQALLPRLKTGSKLVLMTSSLALCPLARSPAPPLAPKSPPLHVIHPPDRPPHNRSDFRHC